MKVYYAKVSSSFQEDTFFGQTELIEPRRLSAVRNMKNETAKMRSLAAGLLLHKSLCDYLKLSMKETPPFLTDCGKWGKPYLTEYPNVHFNLSHSGEYVCCAVAGCEVGVDIQRHQGNGEEKIAERFFTRADNQMLENCGEEEKKDVFFRIWSIRESYIKFTGRGIGQGLDSFSIDWENGVIRDKGLTKARFEEYREIEGYSMCVCTCLEKIKVQWELVNIYSAN